MLQTGMILKARYFILESIGQGGGGHLFLARDLELGTLWAVKEISHEHKKEAKLLRLLSHACLPKMIDYLEKDDYCYLIMEYIKGKSLGEYIREGKKFSLSEVQRIGLEIADVLLYLHTLKPQIIFCDLKPDNIMMSEDGNIFLVDFGSAVFAYDEWTRCMSGTQGYAAPEQYEGRAGVQTDIYGFGKTMLNLLFHTHNAEVILYPLFLGIFIRCCLKTEKVRYDGFSIIIKKLRKIQFYNGKWHFSLFFGMFVTALTFLFAGEYLLNQTDSVSERLTNVMDLYYMDKFWDAEEDEKRDFLKQTAEDLQGILYRCENKWQEDRILHMLALTEEMQGNARHAALYYEQALLLNADNSEKYENLGCFLLRMGEKEMARKVYDQWRKTQNLHLYNKGNNMTYFLKELGISAHEIKPYVQLKGMKQGMLAGDFELSVGIGEGEENLEEWYGWEYEQSLNDMHSEEDSEQSQTGEDEEYYEPEVEIQTDSVIETYGINIEENQEWHTENPSEEYAEWNSEDEIKEDEIKEDDINKEDIDEEDIDEDDINEDDIITDDTREDAAWNMKANKEEQEWNVRSDIDEFTELNTENETEEKSEPNTENETEEKSEPNSKNEEEEKTINRLEDISIKKKQQRKKYISDETKIEIVELPDKIINAVEAHLEVFQIQKEGEIRLRIHSQKAVHVWSARINHQECFWTYQDGELVLEKEGSHGDILQILLIYEKNLSEPEIKLA